MVGKRDIMKQTIFLLLFLLMSSSLNAIDNSCWEDIANMSSSQQTEKIKAIYFSADWCNWCRKLEKDVLADAEVKRILFENFICFETDIDSKTKIDFNNRILSADEMAKHFGISTFPAIVFLNSKDELIGNLIGYYDKDDFLKVLDHLISK